MQNTIASSSVATVERVPQAHTGTYYKQLDTLRCLAVGLVILEHWFASSISHLFDFGFLGVLIFFTLSGFLITGILLRNKQSLDTGQVSKREILKTFYVRRSLRIFPIYYFLLAFLFIFSFEHIREKMGWYALYASNLLTYKQQHWDGMIGPLWSLAVEEQFYLIWPLLILVIPVKKLPAFFYICLAAAPLFRLLSIEAASMFSADPKPELSMRVLMPNCVDSFAAGGLLAYFMRYKDEAPRWIELMKKNVSGIILLAVCIVLLLFKKSYAFYLIFPTIFCWLSVYMIKGLINNVTGWKGKLFSNPATIYLGKISYGIYLFHGPFPLILSIIDFIMLKIGLGFTMYNSLEGLDPILKKSIWVIYLVIFASLSYFIIEKPFNKLKGKFNYS
ncbi:acyltransferase [Pollutibacter soli]|uniref:acyltransferase family protein n=1 Tax=Pollutibacter soli TaxID=3034157 RepID=UPI00301347E0